MNRPRRHTRTAATRTTTRVLVAAALSAGVLLATTGCSDGDNGDSSDVSASPVAKESPASATPLTPALAKQALLTNTDLGSEWTQSADAAAWRDRLLIGTVDVAAFITGKADAADCQQLMDRLYGDDLLGRPSGSAALTGFEDSDDDARMLYQVAAHDRAALDTELAWLKNLPVKCDQFTLTGGTGGDRTVQVTENPLPDTGDARQGLHMTVTGRADGTPATLTLDIAAVRIGANAITVTNGGLDGADDDSTEQAVRQGSARLKHVLIGG